MGQRLYTDRIGTLSYSAPNILLNPSILTIGGQQYITGALSVALSGLVANQLYMIYAVQTAGVVSLVTSINVNSVGPSGFSSWKLVGAFYANGVTGSVAFGSFVNIEGVPETSEITYTPVTGWTGNVTHTGKWRRAGNRGSFDILTTGSGAPTGTSYTIDMTAFPLQSGGFADLVDNRPLGRAVAEDAGTQGYHMDVQIATATALVVRRHAVSGANTVFGGSDLTITSPFTFGTGDFVRTRVFEIPISGWTNTPLKDL